ncbi:MAG: precorrin-3B C(17)-methyltransferase [Magnetospiraceae bacterium]
MTMKQAPAIVMVSAGGLEVALQLRSAFPDATLHGPRGSGVDAEFDTAIPHLQALFTAGTPLIGICAGGILIRALAPCLADKTAEPPVVAVAADGSVAVPLLGGHHGANGLAAEISGILGGIAALTTANDLRYDLALDDPPPGWRLRSVDGGRSILAALAAGDPVKLTVEAGDATWLTAGGAPFEPEGARHLRVTDRAATVGSADAVLHPPTLALGVGCERDADPGALMSLVQETLQDHDLAPDSIARVVSLDLKSDEAAVHQLARSLGVPARFFDAPTLEAETPRLATPSDTVYAAVGCHGVAEAAALACAGAGGALIVPKVVGRRVTCAIARHPSGVDPAAGRPRGRLWVVGLGPGDPSWRAPEATAALRQATDWVGFKLYLDLAQDLHRDQTLHDTPLSQEIERARLALDLAGQGKQVALICSGDAGIYALASLVMELLDREDDPAWRRVAMTLIPGISALQAAAARAGAPLGHDFCTISLSDLLTPWPVIEQRLHGAGAADFVVAFYNPVSQRRRTQLAAARDILLQYRPKSTPVILARNLGRPGESLRFTDLATVSPEDADMLTLVMVGSSQSRLIQRGGSVWVYTPRGYAGKMDVDRPTDENTIGVDP